ncbi:MAG: scramblase [Myxococcales bacterium]|nr:scramblase [Myxococcales bacterium]
MDNSLVPAADAAIAPFVRSNRLSVRQRKRWLEILTSLDARNTYAVYDEAGSPVFNVQEQGRGFGSLLKRLFLTSFRPFRSHVEDVTAGRQILALRRPFRFMFHRLEVSTPDGQLLGALQKRWTWFRRKYTVEGANGEELATLFGPFWRPWTFKILLPGQEHEVGLIQKKWSGLAKEMFTQADNFWVEFGGVADPRLRALLFSATVLIDVVHFERG